MWPSWLLLLWRFSEETLAGQLHDKNDGKALYLIPTLSILWLGRVSGKTALPEYDLSLMVKARNDFCLQLVYVVRQGAIIRYATSKTPVHNITMGVSAWFAQSLLQVRQTECSGGETDSCSINPPTQATRVFGREVERGCTPVLHRCLRRHEKRAGNIRMQLCKGDRDRGRACHSCATVREDMVTGQRTEQEYWSIREA